MFLTLSVLVNYSTITLLRQRKLTGMSDIFELLRRNVSEVDSLNRVSHAGKSPSGECCFKRKILEILLKRLLKTSGI